MKLDVDGLRRTAAQMRDRANRHREVARDIDRTEQAEGIGMVHSGASPHWQAAIEWARAAAAIELAILTEETAGITGTGDGV